MGNRNQWNTWSSTVDKPNGFKSIRPNVYEYEVIFKLYNPSPNGDPHELIKETILIPYTIEFGDKVVDKESLSKEIKRLYAIELKLSALNCNSFIRDGGFFPVVYCVDIPSYFVKEFKNNVKLRNRLNKINQIKRNVKLHNHKS